MSVTVSPKFQIVIPREIRERMNIKPGQKVEIFEIDGIAHIVPVVPITEARGMFKGMNTDFVREKTDRDVSPQ